MAVGYLLFNEKLEDGLIQGQVLSLLKKLSQGQKIFLFVFAPFYSLFGLRQKARYEKELGRNVCLVYIPITIPMRFFIFTGFFTVWAFIYSFILWFHVKKNKLRVIHARGYFASLVAMFCKRKHTQLKLIFDGRSLFVEENISGGKIKNNSLTHRKWEEYEQLLLDSADKVIAVSLPIKEHYTRKINHEKIEVIPTFVDENIVYFDSAARSRLRKNMKIEDRTVVVYTGSFYLWNDPALYAAYFREIKNKLSDAFFLIITRYKTEIEREMKRQGISGESYAVLEVKHNEIKDYLSAGDYGIFVMNEVNDSATRLSVKFVEYLAAGLTPIVNKNAGAASQAILRSKMGHLVEFTDFKDMARWSCELIVRENVIDYYKKEYSSVASIEKYQIVYDALLRGQ